MRTTKKLGPAPHAKGALYAPDAVQSLDKFFHPGSVALIGASETPGSVGRALAENLSAFGGRLFMVNPKRKEVLGRPAYTDILAIKEKVDLAVIATPAVSMPAVIRQCVEARVQAAVIISAGFKECGPAGAALEREVLAEARQGKMRLIGPNCLGVMTPHIGLNATFGQAMALPGQVAFISQSGALCTAILDWSLSEQVGFSAFVSVGSMLDAGWGDLITYFGDDPRTKSIVIYMESVGDARKFLSAAREVALNKPIIALKVGQTEAAAQAAASHTGALTGSDAVLDAAFRRAGVLRVNSIEELFDMAEVLAKQPRPRGPRLSIVTNAGGPGALATDALVTRGGELAVLSEESKAALNEFLPPHWSHGNPIDVLGDADGLRYTRAAHIALNDPNTDGVLVVLTPQAMTDAVGTAVGLRSLQDQSSKPILASWMGSKAVADGEAILNQAGIPTFKYPDRAARAFEAMWRYSRRVRALYETPTLSGGQAAVESRRQAEKILQEARRPGERTILTEVKSKEVLAAYGIPVVQTRAAKTEEEAVALAQEVGYPVVLKLFSKTITHKSDVGGVQLGIRSAAEARRAWRAIRSAVSVKAGPEHFLGVTVQPMISRQGYELILGSSIDGQFGPVLLFGTGGKLVEVFKDSALGLPPLNSTLARRMMEQTKIFAALKGVRGEKPVDLDKLNELVVRFSQLVAEQKSIVEIDINPLLVCSSQIVALDARIVVHPSDLPEGDLPKLAIRPYPTEYAQVWRLKEGTAVSIRPIRPEDEPLMVKFHETLSERSVYHRYFGLLKLDQRVAHERLSRLCFIDYDRELALVVERHDPKTDQRKIIGVGRLSKLRGGSEAEFALTISDEWQKKGVGTQLLRLLIQAARDEKVQRVVATILADNHEMLHVAAKAGFALNYVAGTHEYSAVLTL